VALNAHARRRRRLLLLISCFLYIARSVSVDREDDGGVGAGYESASVGVERSTGER